MIISKEFTTKHTAETPTNADLEAIRQYALREVAPEEVFTGKMALANTAVDRSHERIPLPYLQRFSDTLPGKPVMTGHDMGSLPVGRFYDADVIQRGDGEHEIIARYYLPADSPLRKSVELGITSGVSIHGRADSRTCGICAKDYDRCSHEAGKSYDDKLCIADWGGDPAKYETVEGSFVAAPCQFGAQAVARNLPTGYVTKSAAPGGTIILEYDAADPAPQGDAMTLEQALEKIATLEGELATLKKTETENEPLVTAGKEYLDHLKEDALKKSAAVSDADKKQTEAFLGTITTPNLSLLKTIHGSVMQRFDEKFPPRALGQQSGHDQQQQQSARFDPVAGSPFRRSA